MNLAASMPGVAVNLNFTGGTAALASAATQAGLCTVVTSRDFLEKAKVELPLNLEPIWVEEGRTASPPCSAGKRWRSRFSLQ
ncbi:MAG: hypothetical protein U0794_00935 [Isosphaeraceae bacterium]